MFTLVKQLKCLIRNVVIVTCNAYIVYYALKHNGNIIHLYCCGVINHTSFNTPLVSIIGQLCNSQSFC